MYKPESQVEDIESNNSNLIILSKITKLSKGALDSLVSKNENTYSPKNAEEFTAHNSNVNMLLLSMLKNKITEKCQGDS